MSAVLIAVLYATVSVHAGGQGGYGGFNENPYGYPGGNGNSATGIGGDGGQGYNNPDPTGAGGTVGNLITSPTFPYTHLTVTTKAKVLISVVAISPIQKEHSLYSRITST
ncbi:hypothetical protein NYO63_15395 [Brucella sp. 1315]|nr:hypothetical protein NYO63_15395 [Brucella sp. 1315]